MTPNSDRPLLDHPLLAETTHDIEDSHISQTLSPTPSSKSLSTQDGVSEVDSQDFAWGWGGHQSPPPRDDHIAARRNERRYRLLLQHEFNPSCEYTVLPPRRGLIYVSSEPTPVGALTGETRCGWVPRKTGRSFRHVVQREQPFSHRGRTCGWDANYQWIWHFPRGRGAPRQEACGTEGLRHDSAPINLQKKRYRGRHLLVSVAHVSVLSLLLTRTFFLALTDNPLNVDMTSR